MSLQTIHEVFETPIAYTCDVVVAGGGTAGAIAAIAAAETGAQVVLVEKSNFLGGSLVNHAGPIHSFFNLFQGAGHADKQQVIQGIPQKVIDRLIKEQGSYGHLEQEVGGDHDAVATIFDREIYKNVMNELCLEAGVRILLNTWIAGVIKDGDVLKGIIIENKSGRQAIEAKVTIDCTGDADVAAFAGAPFVNMSSQQLVSLPYALANVDLKKVEAFAKSKQLLFTMVHHKKGEGVEDDIIRMGFNAEAIPEFEGNFIGRSQTKPPQNMESLASDEYKFRIGLMGPWGVNYHENEWGYCNCNFMIGIDATNAEEITKAEIDLRKTIIDFTAQLQKLVPGFEHSYISWTPSFLGIRASRIVRCEYELTAEDISEARRFPDEVALYGYHDYAPREIVRDGKWYGFPYRAFVPVSVENLLCAGRLITVDHHAHMSTRNTAGCMAQGHAVGTAAALAALNGVTVRSLDVGQLRTKLKEQGAFLD